MARSLRWTFAFLLLIPGVLEARISKTVATGSELSSLRVGLEHFYSQYGRYPTRQEGLAVLFAASPQNTEANSQGPILDRSKWRFNAAGVPLDQWGHPYQYVPDSSHVYSMGVDGVSMSGGNDLNDISTWQERHVASSELYVRQCSSTALWSGSLLLLGGSVLIWAYYRRTLCARKNHASSR